MFYFKGWVQCFSVKVVINKCFLNLEKSLEQLRLVVFEKNVYFNSDSDVTEPKARLL